jgi:hypothetical protein
LLSPNRKSSTVPLTSIHEKVSDWVYELETMNLKAFILSLIFARVHSSKDEHAGSLLGINLKSSSDLTISSILYNPTSIKSTWIDSTFGSKAMFYEFGKNEQVWDKKSLSVEEKNNRTRNFRAQFILPEYAVNSVCSIEVLGIAKISKYGLFSPSNRVHSFVGEASIVIKDRSIEWRCFYRPLFENWRPDLVYSEPNFWSVFMFCPAPDAEKCEKLNESLLKMKKMKKDLLTTGYVSFRDKSLKALGWKSAFEFNFVPRKRFLSIDSSDGQKIEALKKLNAAVCLSIPYTSSYSTKESANGAMLLEFIRYYATLGFKVLIYDRDGANKKHIFNSKYGSAQNITIPKGSLVYNPYTIRGLLDPAKKGAKYDNIEGSNSNNWQRRFQSQGHDKVLTLTHCSYIYIYIYIY